VIIKEAQRCHHVRPLSAARAATGATAATGLTAARASGGADAAAEHAGVAREAVLCVSTTLRAQHRVGNAQGMSKLQPHKRQRAHRAAATTARRHRTGALGDSIVGRSRLLGGSSRRGPLSKQLGALESS
jgi:hypothetical protein